MRVFGEQPTSRQSQKRGNAPGIPRPDTGRAERIATISGLDCWRIGVSSGGTIPNSDNDTLEREVRPEDEDRYHGGWRPTSTIRLTVVY